MKPKYASLPLAVVLFIGMLLPKPLAARVETDYISALKDTLNALADRSEVELFRIHCHSIIQIINDKNSFTSNDSAWLEEIYLAFCSMQPGSDPREFSTYLDRKRSLIISWESPADGVVSFTRLRLPADWDPNMTYPLYVDLHGYWDVASNTIQYLNYPFTADPSTSFAFEDGYVISPWGRGNIWYRGIGETDIWECIDLTEELFSIDQSRKYILGHSMGGSGAWYLGHNYAGMWAAIGNHAGALWYDQSNEVNTSVAQQLKDVPVYFVVGTSDGLLSVNQQAYQLLVEAGNPDITFVTFTGGHDYIQENVENMYLWMKNYVNDDYSDIETTMETGENIPGCLWSFSDPVSRNITINFNLPQTCFIELSVYDQNGSYLETLMRSECRNGNYSINWKTGNLPAGLYYCRLRSGTDISTIKLLFTK
jgi:predicted esterase